MFTSAKDNITSRAALHYIKDRLARYGEVQDLKIDSRAKTVRVLCQLHGEPGPVSLTAEKYAVESDDGKKFIRITACTCTSPWIQNLLSDFVLGRRFELPPWAAGVF